MTTDEYDRRWQQMVDAGENPHGEADLVCRYEPTSVLDAGCGTGRVAIELARRGIDVVGTDLDATMLATARAKAPTLDWVHADLATIGLGRTFDVVVLAGNVMIFVEPSAQHPVIARLAEHVVVGGLMIAGYQLDRGLRVDDHDAMASSSGFVLEDRFANWQGEPFDGGAYAVSVHRRAPGLV